MHNYTLQHIDDEIDYYLDLQAKSTENTKVVSKTQQETDKGKRSLTIYQTFKIITSLISRKTQKICLLRKEEQVGFQCGLLLGLSDTGKFFFARFFAVNRGITFYRVRNDALTSKYVDDSYQYYFLGTIT